MATTFRTGIGVARLLFVVGLIFTAGGCGGAPDTSLERLTESRRLAADLLVQLAKATDAGNRTVMADSDEPSAGSAREVEVATAQIQKDVEALRPLLDALGYANEARLLNEFTGRFTRYAAQDRDILNLVHEGTNLKATRLSFGAAREAADAFRDSLKTLTLSAPGADAWRIEALTATAIGEVREIQVLQGPHIAEPDDAAMTGLEQRMAASEAAARKALQSLASAVAAAAQPRVAAATAALDRFMTLNAEIISLSRRNTNVRSLALSLGQKRMLTAACEESLQALQDALAKRGFTGTR